jgi:hypothetical protein
MTQFSDKENTPIKPTEAELNIYATLGKKSFEEKVALTQKAIKTNEKVANMITSPSNSEKLLKDGTTILGAQFAIASAFIHSWIYTNTPLHFPDMDVNFNADVWGFGLGGGVIWLSGWMADTGASILGDVSFAFTTSPVYTEISFWKDGSPVGVLVGGGINIQAGAFGGTGTFSKV